MKTHSFVFLAITSLLLPVIFSCKKELQCPTCAGNAAHPVANAGIDKAIYLPVDSVLLDGSASTDADGHITAYNWRQLSGPTSSVLMDHVSSICRAIMLRSGVYSFELTVRDNDGLTGRDTTRVFVNALPGSLPPVACAGLDQVLVLPASSTILSGACSTDPNLDIASWYWSQISGPSTAFFSQPGNMQTQVSSLTEGEYNFQLMVTDSAGLSSRDTVSVIVEPQHGYCDRVSPSISIGYEEVRQLSVPRRYFTVATVGNKIVYAGGVLPGGNVSPRVDIYDIAARTWTTASLSQARAAMSPVVTGTKIYFAGGETERVNHTPSKVIDIYDAAANSWTIDSLSIPGSNVASAAAGNKLLFIGGQGPGRAGLMDIYDLPSRSWSTTGLPVERQNGHIAVPVGNKVYIAGQFNPYPLRRIDVYDVASGMWTTSQLMEEKGAMGAIVLGNRIYWAQGWTNNWMTCQLETKDLSIDANFTTDGGVGWFYNTNVGQNPAEINGSIFMTDERLFSIYNTITDSWRSGSFPIPTNVYTGLIRAGNNLYIASGPDGGVTEKVYKMIF